MNSLISRKTQKQMSVSWFPAAKFVPLKGTPTWRLHTKPYKVCRVKRFSEYLAYELSHRLILGEAICMFIRRIFFHFSDSGLSVLTGGLFYF